jgi:hypothetical protein
MDKNPNYLGIGSGFVNFMDKNPNYWVRESTNSGHSWKCAHSKPKAHYILEISIIYITYTNFE